MKIQYDPVFLNQLKKADVRIRKRFKTRIEIFEKNPQDPSLHNHLLQKEWEGFKSINITADWRAVYREVHEDKKTIAYFVAIGTHKELYR